MATLLTMMITDRALNRILPVLIGLAFLLFAGSTLASSGAYERPMQGVPSVVTQMIPSEPMNRLPSYAQGGARQLSQAQDFKSRREVIDEVERDYNAKVLKISLNERAGVYEVRILQENGRVRDITVSARG